MSIEGWTRLRARLNNAEAHILREMLVDNGVGTKVAWRSPDRCRCASGHRAGQKSGFVPDLSKAKALMPDLDDVDSEATLCVREKPVPPTLQRVGNVGTPLAHCLIRLSIESRTHPYLSLR